MFDSILRLFNRAPQVAPKTSEPLLTLSAPNSLGFSTLRNSEGKRFALYENECGNWDIEIQAYERANALDRTNTYEFADDGDGLLVWRKDGIFANNVSTDRLTQILGVYLQPKDRIALTLLVREAKRQSPKLIQA
ncbi:MAG TPA: hypothetical protein VIN59_09010 [Alphaproteobacteria bacterium]